MAKKSEKAKAKFIELVNWKKAQPRMKGKDNPWMKLYTSLLDHDPFLAMDNTAQMLTVALWLYAARSGLHIFPADPRWLQTKIPLLGNKPKPDLRPLLHAQDIYGNPSPFVQYCEPPRAKTAKQRKPAKNDGDKKTDRVEESRGEESRVEESRGEQSGDERRTEKKKTQRKTSKTRTKQSQSQTTSEQSTKDPTPADPTNPDALGRGNPPGVQTPAPGSVQPPRAALARPRATYASCYDRHDIQFSRRIFVALRLQGDPDAGDGYSEVCSFAATWHKITQQLTRAPPEVRDELGMRALKEARNIARRKSAKNKSAVWIDVVRKIANKRQNEISCR